MEDLEKRLAQNSLSVVEVKPSLVEKKPPIEEQPDINNAIDFNVTKATLQREGTIERLVDVKQEELLAEAEAKRIQAENRKLDAEVNKAEQEKRKQIAELDKDIASKKKEVEELKAEGDKAKAFFESNKEILEYIGCKSKKTLRVMFFLMFPASIIFMIVRVLALPFTISGKLIEGVIDTVAGICEKIKSNALKIIISVIVIGLLIACGFFAYFYGGKLISSLK